jgi:fumarylpyruvate hydrolase
MSKLLFHLPTPTIPIFTRNTAASSSSKWLSTNESFPVRRIYCVGRNYREHTLEMGGNPDRDAPFFFMKPADAIVNCSPSSSSSSHREHDVTKVPYPTVTSSLHHEGELIIAIGKDGRDIPSSRAADYIYGYSLGCDLTRRDLQSVAKEKGRPWDASKGFDDSCPTSPIVPLDDLDEHSIDDMMLSLKVNGVTKQHSNIGSMIYSISEVIEHLSQLFWLRRGDLIMTGTPAGVGELVVGDEVCIECGDLIPCRFVVGPTVE